MHCLAKRALSCSTTTRVASSINHTPSSCCWQLLHAAHQPHHSHAQLHTQRQLSTMSAAGSKLTEKRCEPCEASHDALDSMGLAMIMDQDTAEKYRQQLDPRWQLVRDTEHRLRIKRRLRTKNFVKALDLFQRVGEVAEQEKHHPDLHLEGWNNVTIELFTHERNGLSENDFIVAAKLDALLTVPEVAALLSKRQPEDAGAAAATQQ